MACGGWSRALTGVIWYNLSSKIPHSITNCSKSHFCSRAQWKRNTQERATLIKALLNLTISVRYRRAITPERLLYSLFSLLICFYSHLPLHSHLFFILLLFHVWKKLPHILSLLIACIMAFSNVNNLRSVSYPNAVTCSVISDLHSKQQRQMWPLNSPNEKQD